MRKGITLSVLSGLALAFGMTSARADAIVYVNDDTHHIGQVDITTHSVVPGSVHTTDQALNPSLESDNLSDIGFDTSGNLYGTTFTGLYSINPSTGAATTIGTYAGETGMDALVGTTTPNILLGASFKDNNLYEINTTNAALSVVTTLAAPSAGDLAFVGSTLYDSAISPSGADELLNASTDSIIGVFHIGSPSGPTRNDVLGLADDGTTLYAFAGTEVFSVDPTNAVLTRLFNYSGQGLTLARGADFLNQQGPIPTPPSSPVPEPASLGIFAAALAALGLVRRCRGNA